MTYRDDRIEIDRTSTGVRGLDRWKEDVGDDHAGHRRCPCGQCYTCCEPCRCGPKETTQ